MPVYISSGGISRGGGGIIYVARLPDAPDANRTATYGRTSDDPVSLWRVVVEAEGTITVFSDSSGRYHGDHNANPAAPTHADDYYFNSHFEHFRVAHIQIGGSLYAWQNPDSAINNYFPF